MTVYEEKTNICLALLCVSAGHFFTTLLAVHIKQTPEKRQGKMIRRKTSISAGTICKCKKTKPKKKTLYTLTQMKNTHLTCTCTDTQAATPHTYETHMSSFPDKDYE